MGSFGYFMQTMRARGVLPELEPEPAQLCDEADKCLKMAPAPHETDVLQWWTVHKVEFPSLSRMARQFLSIPATSASAERVFSLAGRIFGDHTQNQNDCTLEVRMWANVNRNQVIDQAWYWL